MKRIIYLFLVFPLLLISCEKTPIASFSADTSDPVVGQPVAFNNNSHNGDKFEWDFGDGYISNEVNPVHTFTATGSFDVTMTAFSKGGLSDKAILTLNIAIPTLLEIEVREYYSEDVIPDASIILYPTLNDWNAQTHSVSEGFTDGDGVAVFSDLDQVVYYVDVWEATHDNYSLANEDAGFIKTPRILPHKINRFIAWVDIADHSKGAVKGTRDFVIRKLERKAVDKRQPSPYTGTENWQELYNRRSGK
jgi:PKD repeat protein